MKVRNNQAIQSFKDRLNGQPGNAERILDGMEANEPAGLDAIVP
jgi:hypothetical protein